MAAREHIYKEVGGQGLKLFVFAPEGGRSGEGRAAIVFFFGGGFVNGTPEQFAPQSRYLAGRGMVAVTVDYRIRSRHNSTPMDSAADGRSAVRWVRAHAAELGVDPQRIAASGGSAGGCVAALAGLVDEPPPEGEPQVSSRADALVLFNPVLVTAPVEDRELSDNDRQVVNRQRWGGEDLVEVSAWHHVTSAAPPTLILNGQEDTVCPIQTARLFAERMRRHGVRCDLAECPGQGHGFYNLDRSADCYRETLEATDRFLGSLGYVDGPPCVVIPEGTSPEG